MIKIKVMLASLNIKGFRSIALEFIASYLLSKEVKYSIELKIKNIPLKNSFIRSIEFNKSFKNYFLKTIKEYRPDIIGFSCYIWNYKHTLILCKEIKKISPNTIIVFGGPQVSTISQSKEVLEKNREVDVIVRNDGEVTFCDIISHLAAGNNDFSDILGITYRKDSEIKTNFERPMLNDLNEIPSPYLSGVYEKYVTSENSGNLHFFDERNVLLETSRGCSFRCSYCLESYRSFGRMRYFALERLREELKYIMTRIKNAQRLYFLDSMINSSKSRALDLCNVVTQENIKKLACVFELHPDILDQDLINNLGKLNIDWLVCGLQTTNQKVLKLIHREYNPERFARNIKEMQSKGIRVIVDLIVGLPEDNLESFKESLRTMMKLKPDMIDTNWLCLLPGTELYELRDKYNYSFDENEANRVISCNTWSEEEIRQANQLGGTVVVNMKRKNIVKSFFRLHDWYYRFRIKSFFRLHDWYYPFRKLFIS